MTAKPSLALFVTLTFIGLALGFTAISRADKGALHVTDTLSGHDHSRMQHDGILSLQPKAETRRFEQLTPSAIRPVPAVSAQERDPHAYSDGQDFSGLSKPMMGDGHVLAALIIDRLEAVNARDAFSLTYDWQAWFGGDYNRLVVRAEGEVDQGAFKGSRNELLWGHALTAFWDTQLGLRYDSGLGTDRVWGAFGLQGYAPYWVYIEATAYIGEQGRTAFRLEAEYDVLITQKLILQPRVEMNFYSDSDSSRLVSSGLSNIEAGLRLRYEIKREFAPYIGIEWANTFGSAADAIRAQGKKAEETRFVAGIHFWF
ncbi:copper resistance protein B [Crenothrix polyspora]|uniref:Copper resistance protein B n=1 Tax=Crenothrix polyspora TaxID=360316 RepID=A0A1R4H803_9GAMM|nr:copper resistance protein B [Crenothrix polyspora]SJM92339.1 Copper resistance protein B [Crenothrix polyspora]